MGTVPPPREAVPCILRLVPADQGPHLHSLMLVTPPPPHPLSRAFIPQVNSQLKEASTKFSLATAALPVGSPLGQDCGAPFISFLTQPLPTLVSGVTSSRTSSHPPKTGLIASLSLHPYPLIPFTGS